jgi:hypothetical protein
MIISKINSAAAGSTHSFSHKIRQSLWAWGANDAGQLGDGTNQQTVPVRIMDNVSLAAAGESYSLAVKTTAASGLGNNSYGQLGDGTSIDKATPTRIMSNVTFEAAGENHSFAVKEDGTLWAWGSGSYGKLGNGTTTNVKTRQKL